MLKKTIIILILSSFVIAQNPNPCEDPIFDKIEISDIHDLTEREFEYWKIMLLYWFDNFLIVNYYHITRF